MFLGGIVADADELLWVARAALEEIPPTILSTNAA